MFDFRRRCAHGHEGVWAQPAVDEGAHLEAGAALGGHRRHQRRDEGAQTHRLQGDTDKNYLIENRKGFAELHT